MSTKLFNCHGAELRLTMMPKKKRYVAELFIPKEMVKKELEVKSKSVLIRLKTKKEYHEDIRIKIEAKYELNPSGQIYVKDRARLRFENENYSVTISLKPKAYIPRNVIEKAKQTEEGLLNMHIREEGRTSSKYTNYTRNNVRKPYIGGLITPK